MKYNLCKDCINFVQHYAVEKGRGVFSVYCGHCRKFKENELKKFGVDCPYYKKGKSELYTTKIVDCISTLIKIEHELNRLNKKLSSLKSKINVCKNN